MENDVWVEHLEDGNIRIHCPGDVKTMASDLKMPAKVEIVSYSDYGRNVEKT